MQCQFRHIYIANSLSICLLICLLTIWPVQAKESPVKSTAHDAVQIAYLDTAHTQAKSNWSFKLPQTPNTPLTEKFSQVANYCLVIVSQLAKQRIIGVEESLSFIQRNILALPVITPAHHL